MLSSASVARQWRRELTVFGLKQAIQLDAPRYAIDTFEGAEGDHDWLVGAWLQAATLVINAPGHTAQYLKPNTDAAAHRICRGWRRDIWEEFQNQLISLKPIGTQAWRRRNRALVSEAVDLLTDAAPKDIGLVYADPPYTKDQYSRYYNVPPP